MISFYVILCTYLKEYSLHFFVSLENPSDPDVVGRLPLSSQCSMVLHLIYLKLMFESGCVVGSNNYMTN